MAATMLLFFSFQPLFPVLPLYVTAIGGSPADSGLATWVFAATSLLTRPLAGTLADRWGRKPVMVLGAILFGCGPLLYALAVSIASLLGARAIHGVGMALFSTAYQAFVVDLLPSDRRGEGLGLANVASMVTMVGGPLFGEWMVRTSGFSTLFVALSAIGGMGVLVALTLPGQVGSRWRSDSSPRFSPRSSPSSLFSQEAGIRQALRHRGVRIGALGMSVLGVPFGAFIVFLPLLAKARGLRGTGWLFAAYALASSLVQPVAGRIADRRGTVGTVLVGLVLTSLTAAGFAKASEGWALLGLAGLFGVGYGASLAGLSACVQESVSPDLRGSGAAIQYTVFDLLIGLGSWGLGLLVSATDYSVMYATVSGIVLVGLLFVWRAAR